MLRVPVSAAEGTRAQYDERSKEIESLQSRIQQYELDAAAMEVGAELDSVVLVRLALKFLFCDLRPQSLVADYQKLQRRFELKETECQQHERVRLPVILHALTVSLCLPVLWPECDHSGLRAA